MNKKLIYLVTVILIMGLGCKGPAGDKGDTGARGLTGPLGPIGPAKVVLINSSVISDDFVITDPRLATATAVLVYNVAGGTTINLPYYLPVIGKNTYYLWTPSLSKVEIYNAQTAAATQTIVAIFLN